MTEIVPLRPSARTSARPKASPSRITAPSSSTSASSCRRSNRSPSLDEHLRKADQHLREALALLESSEHEAYCSAAYNLRITDYGIHCIRKALLNRVINELASIHHT